MRDNPSERFTLIIPLLMAAALTGGCTQLGDAFQSPFQDSHQDPGDAYEEYLAGDASTILVEISHVPGALWDESTPAEQEFIQELERITDKNVKVETNASLPNQGPDYVYGISELVQLHREHQSIEATDDQIVMHALFLDGEYGGHIAGVAFAPHAFALFKGSIEEVTCENDEPACYGVAQPDPETCSDAGDPLFACQPVRQGVEEWKLTRAVAIHEAGHLLGLVNCPLPMVEDHEMTEDPQPDEEGNPGLCHSANEGSVMHWQVDVANEGVQDLLEEGDVPWRFDDLDIQDARAVQDEASSG